MSIIESINCSFSIFFITRFFLFFLELRLPITMVTFNTCLLEIRIYFSKPCEGIRVYFGDLSRVQELKLGLLLIDTLGTKYLAIEKIRDFRVRIIYLYNCWILVKYSSFSINCFSRNFFILTLVLSSLNGVTRSKFSLNFLPVMALSP